MVTIKLRRGTLAEWVAGNPVLAAGEVGFETDTKKFKVGNGVTPYAGLDYFVSMSTLVALFATRSFAWAPNRAYVAGELATSGGMLYQRDTAYTSGTTFSATGWTLVSGGAPSLADGVVSTVKLAAGAVTLPKLDSTLANSIPVVVQYTGTAWPVYDTNPNRVRIFMSLGYPSATIPTSYNINDVWYDGAGA